MNKKIVSDFKELIYSKTGIIIKDGKEHILERQIEKLVTKSNYSNKQDYYNALKRDITQKLIKELLSSITINKTHFFREKQHFDFMKNNMGYILKNNKMIKYNKQIRVWSAASSTGQEAYSIAMVLKEIMPKDIKIEIIATDISQKVLKAGSKGKYTSQIEENVSNYYLNKYFDKLGTHYIVKDNIRELVKFREFNLKKAFPFKNNMDIIFCRNVMIYFDENFTKDLINKFYRISNHGGLLFIGHSESIREYKDGYKYLEPTIYVKD